MMRQQNWLKAAELCCRRVQEATEEDLCQVGDKGSVRRKGARAARAARAVGLSRSEAFPGPKEVF